MGDEDIEQSQQTPESLKPPPLSGKSIPDREDDREAVLKFLHEETLDQLENIEKQYPGIMDDLNKELKKISPESSYHKAHTSPYTINPTYHIVRFIIYDRYIAEEPQFTQSSDLDFLALAVVTAKGHDTGFTVSPENHEQESVKITTELMKKHGFMTDKISDVEEAILATVFANIGQDLDEQKIKSNPLIPLMMDADLANLGEEGGENELMTILVAMEAGKDPNDLGFLKFTLELMKRHQYYTEAAKYFFSEQKAKNIQALEERITTLRAQGGQPPAENN